FCIVFGLSMDYEVFLLSRVHEAWVGTGDAHRSVAIGIGATARVITTAALIMIVVFTSFVINPDPTVKMPPCLTGVRRRTCLTARSAGPSRQARTRPSP